MKIQNRVLCAAFSTLLSCALLQAQITGVTAGTDLTGGGTSGNVTLNLDTTKVPQLKVANTFTGNQTVSGNLNVTGTITGGNFKIGGNLWGYGSFANSNAYLGFAGNTVSTGSANTAVGYQALLEDTNGIGNTAIGADAMGLSNGGVYNTAVGDGALTQNDGDENTAIGAAAGQGSNASNTSGRGNTFLGFDAGVSVDGLSNSAAIGEYATVGVNNAIILGSTGNLAVTVGIGTSTPYNDYALDIDTTNSNGLINGGVVVNANGGNLYLGMTNGTHKFRVSTTGVAYADGGFVASGADFAESVAVRGERSLYKPGDLLEITSGAYRTLALSQSPYSTKIAGIYSTKPGLLGTPYFISEGQEKTNAEVPLAIVGIVPCNVTAENGAIQEGDLLVASSRPGFAMKGTDRARMLGAVVGKALEPLTEGTGSIQVLVTLQ
jgi:hypothetical protein